MRYVSVSILTLLLRGEFWMSVGERDPRKFLSNVYEEREPKRSHDSKVSEQLLSQPHTTLKPHPNFSIRSAAFPGSQAGEEVMTLSYTAEQDCHPLSLSST